MSTANELLGSTHTLPEHCPICGADVQITVIQTVEESKLTLVDQVEVTCITEPHWSSEEADEWFDWHFQTPYTDWLPVERYAKQWLNEQLLTQAGNSLSQPT